MEEMLKRSATDTTITKDEIITQLIALLRENDRTKQASEIFELAVYVDMLGNKLEQMSQELAAMHSEIQAMKDNQTPRNIRDALSDIAVKAQNRIDDMEQTLGEIKTDMKNKATEIVTEVKSRGKEVLSNVTDFWGVKQKLENIRDKIRGGISETNETLARIDGFAEGMTASNDMFVNNFRVLMGKERKNYKDNMFVKIDSSVLKGPWEWQKKVYQSLEHHIDVAIDKVDNLENRNHGQIKDSVRDYNSEPTVSGHGTVPMVSEEKYEYGAEAFEAFMAKRENTEIAADMTQRDVQRIGKSR